MFGVCFVALLLCVHAIFWALIVCVGLVFSLTLLVDMVVSCCLWCELVFWTTFGWVVDMLLFTCWVRLWCVLTIGSLFVRSFVLISCFVACEFAVFCVLGWLLWLDCLVFVVGMMHAWLCFGVW